MDREAVGQGPRAFSEGTPASAVAGLSEALWIRIAEPSGFLRDTRVAEIYMKSPISKTFIAAHTLKDHHGDM